MGIFDKLFGKHQKEKSPFTIELTEKGIFINGNEISLPTSIERIKEILGEPTQEYWEDNLWRIIWDNHGICTDYGVADNIINIRLLIKPEENVRHLPKSIFKGKVLVKGEPVENIRESRIKVNKHQLGKSCYSDDEVYCYMLMLNYDYKEEKTKDKYAIPEPVENPIHFSDFNFKLMIIEELMYNKELIKPKFDIFEFVKLYEKRAIDLDEEGYEPIPEAVEYFKQLTIDKKLAKEVTEVYQDGGNDIYMNIIPYWDGEDDTFNVRSFEDIKHFPNLKKMTLLCNDPKVFEELRAKGIDAE